MTMTVSPTAASTGFEDGLFFELLQPMMTARRSNRVPAVTSQPRQFSTRKARNGVLWQASSGLSDPGGGGPATSGRPQGSNVP